MKTFLLPDLGEGLTEAEIVEWHVKVGDEIKTDAPLVSVETDKAIVEVPSPRSGRIAKLHAQVGDVVETGRPLMQFADGVDERADTGTVVGEVKAGEEKVEEKAVSTAKAGSATAGVKATPAVRALARRMNVDLSFVKPSGPDGLVTAADVERVAKRFAELGPPEPLRGARRAMAHHMTQAHSEVVPATVVADADIHQWMEDGADITVRLVHAIVAGCTQEPALNTWFDGHALARRVLQKIDVGIAVDTKDGLFVPVLRDVANRSNNDLREGLDRLRADVKARRVPPEELRGSTITLSNFGMIAGRYAAPVVVPPAVAILGAGQIRDEVVAVDGAPTVHRILPLSLTFDHRAVTGGEAARFLAAVINSLESAVAE
ncbi:MAG: 2-oxo acid dehydrogenase subunit E2 [Gammaproteobacteria bacterium]|nr:2-oxo acid dehydrogenase subunit E2 [Gammaproteobacteria bacterium]